MVDSYTYKPMDIPTKSVRSHQVSFTPSVASGLRLSQVSHYTERVVVAYSFAESSAYNFDGPSTLIWGIPSTLYNILI